MISSSNHASGKGQDQLFCSHVLELAHLSLPHTGHLFCAVQARCRTHFSESCSKFCSQDLGAISFLPPAAGSKGLGRSLTISSKPPHSRLKLRALASSPMLIPKVLRGRGQLSLSQDLGAIPALPPLKAVRGWGKLSLPLLSHPTAD